MIEINPDLWKQEPFKPLPEQIRGVEHLLSFPREKLGGSYAENEAVGLCLFDEQGVAKTRQIIDAACTLFQNKIIDTVVVVAPSSVRTVWDYPDAALGEIAKWCWVPYQTLRFDSKLRKINYPSNCLTFIIVSYGFLRKQSNKEFVNVKNLKRIIDNRKSYLVFDETSYIKSRSASQTQACIELRSHPSIRRVALANGTPIANDLTDLYTQFLLCDPAMLGYNFRTESFDVNCEPLEFTQFKAKCYYLKLSKTAIKGKSKVEKDHTGKEVRKPVFRFFYDFEKEDGKPIERKDFISKLKRHAKSWSLRRLFTQCVDLPPKIYKRLEVDLSAKDWKIYSDMRDNLVAWFKENPAQAANGAVKTIRLTQITSGFLGGVLDVESMLENQTVEIHRAKLDVLLEYLETLPREKPVIIWCRFTEELERVAKTLSAMGFRVGVLHGGVTGNRRTEVIASMQRGELDYFVANAQAGGIGLNLAIAHIEVYVSIDHNLITRLQSESRTFRRGQTEQVIIVDLVAVGPTGQKTYDDVVLRSLMNKEDIALWGSEEWIENLKS